MAESHGTSLVGFFGRIVWMFLGPMLLALMTFLVVKNGNGWLTSADLGFLVILCIIPLARALEFQFGDPQTAEGEPANAGHLRRYVLGVGIIGAVVWVVANILGNYVFGG